MKFGLRFAAAAACLASCLASVVHGQTIHQAFNINPDGTNDVGIRYFNSAFGVQQNPWAGITIDGESLLLRDKSWYDQVDPLGPDVGPPVFTPEARFPFVGSGIDIIHIRDNAGEPLHWEIVDGGSNDAFNVVASGVIQTHTPNATPFLETVTLAAAGTLDANKMHLLRTWIEDTDMLGSSGRRRIFIDAFGVHGDAPITFDDNSNLSGNWTFSGGWADAAADLAYEGDRAASPGAGATIDFDFEGTSLVVYGWGQAGVSGVYDWEIDGGAGGSGRVDQSLDRDYAVRWPELLVNGLSSGPHTLTITVEGSGTAGAFQPNLGFAQIDVIGVYDSGVTVVNNANFNGDDRVDGADFLAWQRGFLGGTTLDQGDANGDGAVNGLDYGIWKAQFGTTGLSTVASGAVPEPCSLALLGGSMALLRFARGRRAQRPSLGQPGIRWKTRRS